MTTMLERAARAMVLAEQDQWDLPAEEWDRETLETHGLINLARAVLMAVREPDGDVIAAGERNAWDSSNSMPAMRAMSVGFTAMIDAILNGDA